MNDIMDICPSCGGQGYIDVGDVEDGVTDVCPDCDGSGEMAYEE
jgi:DnaJ-class molecular chaperone